MSDKESKELSGLERVWTDVLFGLAVAGFGLAFLFNNMAAVTYPPQLVAFCRAFLAASALGMLAVA